MIQPSRPSYCFVCGDELVERFVAAEERARLVCVGCNHIHYINPKIVAGTIPVAGDRVWLLRRAIEPRGGFWTFPAGFMEMGETVEEAAARETMEELRLEIHIRALVGVYSYSVGTTVHVIYLADALSEPAAGPEALSFAAFAPDDLPWHDLAFPSTREALRDWQRNQS